MPTTPAEPLGSITVPLPLNRNPFTLLAVARAKADCLVEPLGHVIPSSGTVRITGGKYRITFAVRLREPYRRAALQAAAVLHTH